MRYIGCILLPKTKQHIDHQSVIFVLQLFPMTFLFRSLLVLTGMTTIWCQLPAQSWITSDYNGYRCAIMQVSDVSVKGDKVRFTCSLVNTGKEELRFDPGHPVREVVFTGDRSFQESELSQEQELIGQGLLRSGIRIKPGEILTGQKLVLDRQKDMTPLDHPVQSAPVASVGDAQAEEKTYSELAEDGCPDLVIDSLWVMGQKRNSLQLMIRLHNRGDGPAHLYTADRQDKGMGVSFYFGTSERISRGSMFIQGEHIDDGLNEAKGMLLPGQSLVKSVNLDMRRHTRFLTAVQCRVDTFQRVVECDETNNEFTYFLR